MSNISRLEEFCDKCNLEYPEFEYGTAEGATGYRIINKIFWYGKEVDLSDYINRRPNNIAWILLKYRVIDYQFFLQLIIDDRKKYPNGKTYHYYKNKYSFSMKRKIQSTTEIDTSAFKKQKLDGVGNYTTSCGGDDIIVTDGDNVITTCNNDIITVESDDISAVSRVVTCSNDDISTISRDVSM